MTYTVTTELVEAYSLCPRKAFLLMAAEPNPGPHEYVQIIDEITAANRQIHRANLEATGDLLPDGTGDLTTGAKALVDTELEANGLHARCDFLTKMNESSRLGKFSYEPVKVIGTRRASPPDTFALAYQGIVLGDVQGRLSSSGTLVLANGRCARVKLATKYKEVRRVVDTLRSWEGIPSGSAPTVVLNKHCAICPFRDACLRQAEHEDNLSLLDRMTPKLMRKYREKGIFTVQQLSHLFKPRRSRKKTKRQVRHSLELQALAIRTGKVHVEHLPELPRKPVELFLDLEGVPDQDFYYLAGLLACRNATAEYESFWADDATREAAMWSALIDRLRAFPSCPIYHYGSYEKTAFVTLARRHGMGHELSDRLVNVAPFVFGKVYFPVRSNGLKAVARFLGAAWTDPQASGLQSLVWRRKWEMTRDERFRQSLLTYNREDSEAVRLLVDRLDQITRDASTDPAIEFGSRPKRHATATGNALHTQFERILSSAEQGSQIREIRIRERPLAECEPRKRGATKGHQAYRRVVPAKANRVVRVQPKRMCPKGHGRLSLDSQLAEKTIIDLTFTSNGCRKTVTRYEGKRSRCPKCEGIYEPPALRRLGHQQFGHSFRAWIVYQRVILRLPYRIIAQVTEHMFGIGMSATTGVNFLHNMANYYASTEAAMLRAVVSSAFVHVDETKINIQGVDNYVWVFTDGKHVVFRMTETREADIVREVLAGFQGVLVSDFYPGYDSMPCRQQKCLVHLIRDINDELWKAPFDRELESFAVQVQALLVPILVEVDQYGLKAWHLRKFLREVARFYDSCIIDKEYTSEPVQTFQKRFNRYRESLFTFLTQDGIPWENNMAERAIRQLAVQRKISGSFSKRVAPQYLLLLAIAQSCRFQGKSFIKFLLSKKTDLESFRRSRPVRYSYAVPKRKDEPTTSEVDESISPNDSDEENIAARR